MPIANVGKSICTVKIGGDIFMLFQDFLSAPTVMTLKTSKTATTASYSTVTAEMPSSSQKWRALCFRRVFPSMVSTDFPVRFVPLILANNMSGSEIRPFYEVINPSMHMLSDSMGLLTFWSNMTGTSTDYSFSNVYKVEQDKISSLPSSVTVKRVLYNCLVNFNKYYVTGGTIYSGATQEGWETVPVCLKPVAVTSNDSDYPAFDFASGGGGSGGFKVHNHSDSANGGFAFACYHPGTSVPQKPWR